MNDINDKYRHLKPGEAVYTGVKNYAPVNAEHEREMKAKYGENTGDHVYSHGVHNPVAEDRWEPFGEDHRKTNLNCQYAVKQEDGTVKLVIVGEESVWEPGNEQAEDRACQGGYYETQMTRNIKDQYGGLIRQERVAVPQWDSFNAKALEDKKPHPTTFGVTIQKKNQ